MGLLRFEIVPSNPHGIYYAGCPIFGKVYLDIDAPKTIRGIEIRYKGEAQVRYPAGDRTRRAKETYLDMRYLIFGDGENETEIEEGCHVFPFSWMLPSMIPCSFEGFYGRVRYSIKAVVDRPWKTDHVVKIPFTIVPILDLNREPLAALPVYEENDKSFWENADGLRMSVALPVRGYVPGQNVPIKVKIANESEMVVEKLRVTLKKLVTYKIGESSRSRKEVIADFELDVEEGQDLALLNLKIPALPPSNLQHCSLIDIDYKLKVEARLEGWFNKNPKVRTDIIIGTIPLLTYQVPRHATEKSSTVDIKNDTLPGPSDTDGRDIGFVFPMEIEEYSSSLPKSSFEKCENFAASKREKDEPASEDSEGDSDEEIASSFDPKYTVYEFEPSTPAD